MVYAWWILAHEDEVAPARSFDDVLPLIERSLEQGDYGSGGWGREEISSLSRLLLGGRERGLVPSAYSLEDGSPFHRMDERLRDEVASSDDERLLNTANPWSDEEPWRGTGVNPFDLAGNLLRFADFCRRAKSEGKVLFVLLENEE